MQVSDIKNFSNKLMSCYHFDCTGIIMSHYCKDVSRIYQLMTNNDIVVVWLNLKQSSQTASELEWMFVLIIMSRAVMYFGNIEMIFSRFERFWHLIRIFSIILLRSRFRRAHQLHFLNYYCQCKKFPPHLSFWILIFQIRHWSRWLFVFEWTEIYDGKTWGTTNTPGLKRHDSRSWRR